MRFNTWLPGDKIFAFNDGAPRTLGYKETASGGSMLAATFTIPNAQAGFGITYDMVSPVFAITKPPKVFYASTAAFNFSIKDSDGWVWRAPCPQQDQLKERGWEWAQFSLAPVQEVVKDGMTPPAAPSTGNILLFQFNGGDGVHGSENDIPQSISISYVAARTPVPASVGTIRMASLLDKNANAHILKVGDVDLVGGSRREIKYLGTLPFGLMIGGPSRSRLANIPFRGPYIAGYQSGTPWVDIGDETRLEFMLDFMLESQLQFQNRSPSALLGPFMHSYLPATWDSEQYGTLDTWVWDGPDGNPAWNGWQYRAFDAMSATWQLAVEKTLSLPVQEKARVICTRFLEWIADWMKANVKAYYIPSSWGPNGWTQGVPLPPDSYLDPHGNSLEAHDLALVLKGAIFCAKAGADQATCMYVIAQCLQSLTLAQSHGERDPMRGCFTLNPTDFESYSFHQGEIMDALALAMRNPELLPERAKGPVLNPGSARPPLASLAVTALDFGSRPVTWTTTQSVKLTNMGGSPLTVTGVSLSGSEAFSLVAGGPVTLQSWQSVTLSVDFTPSVIGAASSELVIVSDDPAGDRTVSLTGAGRAVIPQTIQVSPLSLAFSDSAVGGEVQKILTIGNSGDLDLTISAPVVSGSVFSIVGTVPTTIGAGGIVQVSVQFAPADPVSYTGQILIASDSAVSPVAVSLAGTGIAAAPSGISWLTADGALLRDQSGDQVMLRSVNWYGLEQAFIPGGLWDRPYKTITVAGVVEEGILDEAKRLGFNSIRLLINQDITWAGTNVNTPTGLPAVYTSPYMNPDLFNNPTGAPLSDLTASPQPVIDGIQILDKVVAYCASIGLRVVLDMHTLAPDNDNVTGTNGKWYTTATPDAAGGTSSMKGTLRNEQQAIDAWVFLADRYRNQPVVCGADLINEPWQCSWDDNPLTGVAGYYERVGAAIQAVNPNMLLICEGVAGNIDHTPVGEEGSPESAEGLYQWGTLWGGKLDGARSRLITMPVLNKVVYSPHEYGSHHEDTSIAHQWFHPQDVVPGYPGPAYPENMFEVWRREWGYLAEENIAPVWIGEFGSTLTPGGINWGTGGDDNWFDTSYEQQHYDLDAQWLQKLQEYCNTNSIGHAWWSFNPGTVGGIVESDWKTPLEVKYRHLRDRYVFPSGPMWGPAAPVTTPVDLPYDDSDYLADDDETYLVDDDDTQLIDG